MTCGAKLICDGSCQQNKSDQAEYAIGVTIIISLGEEEKKEFWICLLQKVQVQNWRFSAAYHTSTGLSWVAFFW